MNLRNEARWVFLNTLFSVSEAVMYMQLVDRMDQGRFLSFSGGLSYQALYQMVAKALYRTHVEGKLKAEIIQVRLWFLLLTHYVTMEVLFVDVNLLKLEYGECTRQPCCVVQLPGRGWSLVGWHLRMTCAPLMRLYSIATLIEIVCEWYNASGCSALTRHGLHRKLIYIV